MASNNYCIFIKEENCCLIVFLFLIFKKKLELQFKITQLVKQLLFTLIVFMLDGCDRCYLQT